MPEHAMAHRRSERHREYELRVVLDADPVREIGPAPVEDELALAVRLHVRGRGGDELLAVVEGERAGEPAGFLTDAAAFLETREPGVLDERRRVLTDQRVPFGLRDLADAVYDSQL